jgi:hypothetical protein
VPDRRHSFLSFRIEKMSGLRRFENEAENALFELPVRNRKSIALPRVFPPGLHHIILEIHPRILRILIDAPSHGAVASPNSLIFVQRIQEFQYLFWINFVCTTSEELIANRQPNCVAYFQSF